MSRILIQRRPALFQSALSLSDSDPLTAVERQALTSGVSSRDAATLGEASGVATGAVTKFFNSSEYTGSDTLCILADDFQRGWWYRVDADHVPGGAAPGNTTVGEAGWFGQPNPTGGTAIDATSQMLGLPYCAYYGDPAGNQGGVNYALHELSAGSGSGTPALYDEIWARWYYKQETGRQTGANKHTNVTVFAGDIAYGNIQFNCGTGSASSTAEPYIQKLYPAGQDFCQSPNIAGIAISPGTTYCFGIHVKLSTTSSSNDGIFRVYCDACGTDGLSPPESRTLRIERTGINFGRTHPSAQTNPSKIEVLWFEDWSNPASSGKSYLGGIYVRSGNNPVGFYGSP